MQPKQISYGRVWEDRRPGRSKPWQAIPNDPVTGKPVRPSKTFASEAEANAWLGARRVELSAIYRDAGVPVARSTQTFAELAALYLSSYCTLRGASRRAAEWHTRQLVAEFGDQPQVRIDRAAVKRYRAALATQPSSTGRPLSVGAQCDRLHALEKILEVAVDEQSRTDNPASGLRAVERNRARRTGKHVYSDDEVALLVKVIPEWAAPAVLLGRYAGLRPGEVAGLCWEQLDLTPNALGMGRVLVDRQWDRTTRKVKHETKGRVSRSLPLIPALVEALAELPRVDARVITYLGTPASTDRLSEAFNGAVEDAGIVAAPGTQATPHGLRASFAEAMRRADFPDWARMAGLRHAPAGTLGSYERYPRADELDPWFAKL